MHLQQSDNTKLTAVDLFCGGGGLTVGLKRAGFSVISAIDNDHAAVATYKANHPEIVTFCDDITNFKGEQILKQLPSEHVDLVAGCPPCQGFTSLTAKYKRNDPRNDLIFELFRIVQELSPRAVMMENVPGLAGRGRPKEDGDGSKLCRIQQIIN
jgi:DNA (cytosine-5)-methyltransferase 1